MQIMITSDPDLEPYCGIKTKPPKGKRFGTPSECADTKQIRRYGLNQVNQQVIEDAFERAKQRPKRKRDKSKSSASAKSKPKSNTGTTVEELLNQLAEWFEDNKFQIAMNVLNGQNVDLTPVVSQIVQLFEKLGPQNFMRLISTVVRRILELIVSYNVPTTEEQTEFTEISNRIKTIQQPRILKMFYIGYVTAFTEQVFRMIEQQNPIGPNDQIVIPNLPRLAITDQPTPVQQLATINPPIPKPTTQRVAPPTRKEQSHQLELFEDDNPPFLAQINPPISESVVAPQSKSRRNQPIVFTLNPEDQTLQFLAQTQPPMTPTTQTPDPSRPIRTKQPLLQLMEGDGREFLAKVNQPIQGRKTIDLPQSGQRKSSVQPIFELIEDENQGLQYLAEIQSPLPKQLTTVVSTSSTARPMPSENPKPKPKAEVKPKAAPKRIQKDQTLDQITQIAFQSALSKGRDIPFYVANNRIYTSAATSPHVDRVSGFGKRKTSARNVMQNLNNFIDRITIEMPRNIPAGTARNNYITQNVLEYMEEFARRERWIGFFHLSRYESGYQKPRNIEAYDQWIDSIIKDPFKKSWVLYYQDIPWK